ncbi:hypothetical protein AYO21_06175 [Fonsecaea monophora]|uniref:Uncharacterized protein n=1 Tax=Fonsecaea monophora TaxID=254056 RepID=A0A177F767_9EURO|nr:hypothetical protein AYO21_06175 [Fonsecaea monophora]OAG39531.1 hypothetical protein AYO21_06175 [Fonsecaea monophora]
MARSTASEALDTESTSSPRLSSTTESLQAAPNFWTPQSQSQSQDLYADYLQDSSYVTSPSFENQTPDLTFEANSGSGYTFDLQMEAHVGPLTQLPQHSQHTSELPAAIQNYIPGPSPELLEPADTITALSRLNADFARQVSNVDAYIWGPANAAHHCLEKLHRVEGNPMAELLQSTSRFVSILESLAPLSSLQKSSTTVGSAVSNSNISDLDSWQRQTYLPAPCSQSQSPSTRLSSLSIPVVLMLLSSYLLLLELYNTVFNRVTDAMSKLGDMNTYLQDLPEFQVAGLPSMKAQLYAKIIVQVIEHHFNRLERLLGLPEEFGLSERAADSEGLLSTTPGISQLLHIAMTQTAGWPRTSGTSTLKSLRSHLRDLQGMLST